MDGGDCLVAAAVEAELSALFKKTDHTRWRSVGGRVCQTGILDKVPVRLLVTGPGLVNVVQAVTSAIEQHPPALLIMTGSAGVFRGSGLTVGDIGIAEQEIDAHLGLEPQGTAPGFHVVPTDLPFTVVRYDGYDYTGVYPLDTTLVTKAHEVVLQKNENPDLRIIRGPFLTVSTITTSEDRANALEAHYKPLMENMEGSGAAHLALHYGLPFLEVRAGANIVGRRERSLWRTDLAHERCSWALKQIIPTLFPEVAP